MRSIGNSRLWIAFVAFALFFGALAVPVKTAVFTGLGPRGRGLVSWLKLVESSPELDLMLVDAAMIRAGALDRAELLIIPGGASVVEKKDLGPEGAARIRDFVRRAAVTSEHAPAAVWPWRRRAMPTGELASYLTTASGTRTDS